MLDDLLVGRSEEEQDPAEDEVTGILALVFDLLDGESGGLREAADGGAGIGPEVGGEGVCLGAAFGVADDPGVGAIRDQAGREGGVVPEVGGEEEEPSSGAEDAMDLAIDGGWFEEVFHDADGVDEVDGGVLEGEGTEVGAMQFETGGGGGFRGELDEVDADAAPGAGGEADEAFGVAPAPGVEEDGARGGEGSDGAFEAAVGVGLGGKETGD